MNKLILIYIFVFVAFVFANGIDKLNHSYMNDLEKINNDLVLQCTIDNINSDIECD